MVTTENLKPQIAHREKRLLSPAMKVVMRRSLIAVGMGLFAAAWAGIVMELLVSIFTGEGLSLLGLVKRWPLALLVLLAAYTAGVLSGNWIWRNRKNDKVQFYAGIAWMTIVVLFGVAISGLGK